MGMFVPIHKLVTVSSEKPVDATMLIPDVIDVIYQTPVTFDMDGMPLENTHYLTLLMVPCGMTPLDVINMLQPCRPYACKCCADMQEYHEYA